jgi:hypothetical protein
VATLEAPGDDPRVGDEGVGVANLGEDPAKYP